MNGLSLMARSAASRAERRDLHEPLTVLVGRLVDNGVRWLSAELRLVKAEGRAYAGRLLWSVVLLLAALAFLLGAVVVMVQVAAIELSRFTGAAWSGGLLACVAALVVAALALWLAFRLMKPPAPSRSPLVRWIADTAPPEDETNG